MAAQYNRLNNTLTEHSAVLPSLIPFTAHRLYEVKEPGGIYDVQSAFDDDNVSDTSPLQTQTDDPLSITLLALYDDLYGVFSANEFYYQAVEAITADCQLNISPEAKFGLIRNARWLRRQQNAILTRLEQIREAVQAAER